MTAEKYIFLRKYLPAYLIFFVGLAITAVAGKMQIHREEESQQARLQQQADQATFVLQRSFDRYIEVLLSIQDHYKASQHVSFNEFIAFTKRALSNYSGITSLEWLPEIRQAERIAFEEKMKMSGFPNSGFPSFEIFERKEGKTVRAENRPYFYPITYVAPFAKNAKAVGFDVASEITRKDTFGRVRATGQIATTSRITLIQDLVEDKKEYGFLAIAPIKNESDRQDMLIGAFRVADIAMEALQDFKYHHNLYFYDSVNRTENSYFGMFNSKIKQFTIEDNLASDLTTRAGSLCQNLAKCTRSLKVGDRQWSVLIVPTNQFEIEQSSYVIPLTVMGSLITLGTSIYFGMIVHSADKLKTANHEIARLNTELKSDNIRMEAELDILQKMQQMILPKPHELLISELDISGFSQAAEDVGGDYFDVLNNHGVLTISIGDVTGHGLESGILMLMAQTAVRTLKEIGVDNSVEFLDILNRTLYGNLQRINSDKNLTLVLLNYSHGLLNISGQHEEVLFVKENGEVERIDTIDLGFPIGLTWEIKDFIDCKALKLTTGQGIVLYTDGITEAENAHREFYGIERLCKIVSEHWQLPAKQIQQQILDDLHAFIGQQKIYDDITLLIIKKEKPDNSVVTS
jgi:serine phosphatase RsbU (regulator of sigma subunit)/CHASE1-domain containing sensor protein